jgi:predicted TIM-barrel enzyme
MMVSESLREIHSSRNGPILTPSDAAFINERTDAVGFVGASSLERMAVEQSLINLTQEFKSIPVKRMATQ